MLRNNYNESPPRTVEYNGETLVVIRDVLSYLNSKNSSPTYFKKSIDKGTSYTGKIKFGNSPKKTFILGDALFVKELIGKVQTASQHEKKLMMQRLIYEGVFKDFFPVKSTKEAEFFGKLERHLWNEGMFTERQYKAGPYFVDLYATYKNTNLDIFIEYDEDYHQYQTNKDSFRKNEIIMDSIWRGRSPYFIRLQSYDIDKTNFDKITKVLMDMDYEEIDGEN